jgi:hypothetical protein
VTVHKSSFTSPAATTTTRPSASQLQQCSAGSTTGTPRQCHFTTGEE